MMVVDSNQDYSRAKTSNDARSKYDSMHLKTLNASNQINENEKDENEPDSIFENDGVN